MLICQFIFSHFVKMLVSQPQNWFQAGNPLQIKNKNTKIIISIFILIGILQHLWNHFQRWILGPSTTSPYKPHSSSIFPFTNTSFSQSPLLLISPQLKLNREKLAGQRYFGDRGGTYCSLPIRRGAPWGDDLRPNWRLCSLIFPAAPRGGPLPRNPE